MCTAISSNARGRDINGIDFLQICGIPTAPGAIEAMCTAISSNARGRDINWIDFKCYMAGEFTAGRNMLSGDYVLPTGQALPFGLTIKRLKRYRCAAYWLTECVQIARFKLHYSRKR